MAKKKVATIKQTLKKCLVCGEEWETTSLTIGGKTVVRERGCPKCHLKG